MLVVPRESGDRARRARIEGRLGCGARDKRRGPGDRGRRRRVPGDRKIARDPGCLPEVARASDAAGLGARRHRCRRSAEPPPRPPPRRAHARRDAGCHLRALVSRRRRLQRSGGKREPVALRRKRERTRRREPIEPGSARIAELAPAARNRCGTGGGARRRSRGRPCSSTRRRHRHAPVLCRGVPAPHDQRGGAARPLGARAQPRSSRHQCRDRSRSTCRCACCSS